jgi:hypothetical protein
MTPSTDAAKVSRELKAAIHAAVADGGAPDILRAVQEACEKEYKKSLKAWHEEGSHFDDDVPDHKYIAPVWMFWQSLPWDLDWVIKNMEKRIRHRDMTTASIDAESEAEEIERKERELADLKKRKRK